MRPTRAVIDTDALKNNIRLIRGKLPPETRVMAVLKANCYGHEESICVPAILDEGIDIFGVATIEEGARLRRLGLRSRIVMLPPPLPGQHGEFIENDVEAVVSTATMAEEISRAALSAGRRLPLHLFIDTGMARNGAAPGDAVEILEKIQRLEGVEIVGIASHLATSDEPENDFTLQQQERFEWTVRQALDAGFSFRDIHLANSGGIFNFPASHHTLVRPGLSLYGYHATAELQSASGLQPVMELRTVVSNIYPLTEGTSVSYGRRFYTPRPTRIATLPIGYADGILRVLSNQLQVLIGGRRYRVVGTVCMDEMMIDLGDDTSVAVGDEVIIIGASGGDMIDAWDIALEAGTIPYEICTAISSRVPRMQRPA